MTANKRIFINVVATYLRSLYGIVLGLFTARWMLGALGVTDFGLWGLIGGLVGFISFLNMLLAVSTSRFFAYAVGQKQGAFAEEGLKECRAWFTCAFSFHFILGLVLVSLGYPAGSWAIRSYLTIPPDRVDACIWVWRLVCLNCFVGMVNVPFAAMYKARQEIAEMTLYGFCSTTANAILLYYMITHPGIWLVAFAIWHSVIALVPMMLMCIRAFVLFDECRFVSGEFLRLPRLKKMIGYSLAQFLADFASLITGQGLSILVNRSLGPAFNASMTVANRVSDQTLTLGSAMIGALSPAITNAAGAGQYDRMRTLAYQSCKLGVLFVLVFAIPMVLEVDEVMILWLKNPPVESAALCSMMILSFVLNRSTAGLSSAIEALGKIAAFKSAMGLAGLLPLLLAGVFMWFGYGLRSVGIGFLLTNIPFSLIRLYYAKRLAKISVRYWMFKIFMPILIIFTCGIVVGGAPRFFMEQSFLRVVVTTFFVLLVVLPMSWFVALTADERSYVKTRLNRVLNR